MLIHFFQLTTAFLATFPKTGDLIDCEVEKVPVGDGEPDWESALSTPCKGKVRVLYKKSFLDTDEGDDDWVIGITLSGGKKEFLVTLENGPGGWFGTTVIKEVFRAE